MREAFTYIKKVSQIRFGTQLDMLLLHVVCLFSEKKYSSSHDDNHDNLNSDDVTLYLPVHVTKLSPPHVFSGRTHQILILLRKFV